MKKSDRTKIAKFEKKIDQLARKMMVQKIKSTFSGQKKTRDVNKQPKDYI